MLDVPLDDLLEILLGAIEISVHSLRSTRGKHTIMFCRPSSFKYGIPLSSFLIVSILHVREQNTGGFNALKIVLRQAYPRRPLERVRRERRAFNLRGTRWRISSRRAHLKFVVISSIGGITYTGGSLDLRVRFFFGVASSVSVLTAVFAFLFAFGAGATSSGSGTAGSGSCLYSASSRSPGGVGGGGDRLDDGERE